MSQATQLSQKQGELSKRNLQNYAEALRESSSDSFQIFDSCEIILPLYYYKKISQYFLQELRNMITKPSAHNASPSKRNH